MMNNKTENSTVVFWLVIIASGILLAVSYLLLPPVCFFILVALLLSSFFYIKPNWGACCLILVIPVIANEIGFIHKDFAWARNQIFPIYFLVMAANVFFLFIRKTVHNQKIFNNTHVPLLYLILVFGTYASLSFMLAPNTTFSFMLTVLLLANIALYFYLLAILQDAETHKFIMKAFAISGLVVGLMTTYSIIAHPEYSLYQDIWNKLQFTILWNPRVRLRGFALAQPNFTSMTLNLSIFITAGLVLSSTRVLTKCLGVLVLVFLLFAQCLTASKGGLGALLMASYCIILLNSSLRRWFFIAIPMATIILLAVFFISTAFMSLYGTAFHSDLTGGDKDFVSMSSRLIMWKTGFGALADETLGFLTGLGIGGFTYGYKILWPHNLTFSFYFDFGIVGLIFLGGIIFYLSRELLLLKSVIKLQQSYIDHMLIALVCGFIAVMIHSLVDFHYNQTTLWTYLALLLATLQIAKAEYKRKSVVQNEENDPDDS